MGVPEIHTLYETGYKSIIPALLCLFGMKKTSSTTGTTNYPRNISWNISCRCNASHVCKPMKSASFASTSSTFVLLASKLECVQDCQNEEVGFLTLCFVGSCLEGRGFRKHSGQHWNCFKGNIAIGGISERQVGVRNMWAFLSAPVDI